MTVEPSIFEVFPSPLSWEIVLKALPLLSLALLLAGCAVQSPESRMGEAGQAPVRWSATAQAKQGIDDQWVERFGAGELKALVAQAYNANRDLQAAAARVERAAALAKAAGADARPQLNAALSGSRDKRNFIGFPFGGGGVASKISNQYGAQLSLSWELDLWGRIRAGQSAALADLNARAQQYRAAKASLAAQVVRAWLLVGGLHGQIALADQALKSRLDTADSVRGRFERAVGGAQATASQVRLAQADVESARAALAARKAERDQALRQLEVLLGRYPDASLTGASGLPALKGMPPAGLPSELLLRRPDILAAERRLAAAGSRRKQSFLAFFPSFSLTGSGGRSTEQLADISESEFGVWSIAGQLAQPILSGGQLSANLKARSAEEREALANLQQVVLNGFSEVEIALAAEEFLATRSAALESAAQLARDAENSARQEFTRGTADVLTLLTATTRRIELDSQALTLRRLRLENRVNLHLALGGDYNL